MTGLGRKWNLQSRRGHVRIDSGKDGSLPGSSCCALMIDRPQSLRISRSHSCLAARDRTGEGRMQKAIVWIVCAALAACSLQSIRAEPGIGRPGAPLDRARCRATWKMASPKGGAVIANKSRALCLRLRGHGRRSGRNNFKNMNSRKVARVVG